MITKGIIEVILYVENMNDQVSFYRDTLGLALLYPQGMTDFSQEMWVTLDTGACTLALHGGGKGRLGKDTPKVVFGVDDINAARDLFVQRGVAFGEVRSAAPGVYISDAVDPEGNPISIESHVEG